MHVLDKSVIDWLRSTRAGHFEISADDRSAAETALGAKLIDLLVPLTDGAVSAARVDLSLEYALRHIAGHGVQVPAAAEPPRRLECVLGLRFVAATAELGNCTALVADLTHAAHAVLDKCWRFVLQYSHLLSQTSSAV